MHAYINRMTNDQGSPRAILQPVVLVHQYSRNSPTAHYAHEKSLPTNRF